VIARTPEPPYYAVIFTSLRTEGDQGYAQTAEEMERLAAQQPGYLGIESARDAGGLGITVNQVWSAKAELADYVLDSATRTWMGNLVYTLYDHFGLDWPDIVKHGERHTPQYYTGDFFKAWYILQHYRSAKPFITEMKKKIFIYGSAV